MAIRSAARTTSSGSAIRHERQRRHVRLSEPAPPRRVDGDLSPRRLARPLAVVARGANPMLGEDFRPVAWKFRRPPSFAGRSLRPKEWRRLSTPINSAGSGSLVQFVFALPARPPPAAHLDGLVRRAAKPKTLSTVIHAPPQSAADGNIPRNSSFDRAQTLSLSLRRRRSINRCRRRNHRGPSVGRPSRRRRAPV